MKKKTNKDRNFDDLAPKFQKKVYGGLKGQIRLAVLNRDLSDIFPQVLRPPASTPLKVLDAGSGHAPFSLDLASLGHQVTLCDISSKMLEKATVDTADKNLESSVKILHTAIQDLPQDADGSYDIVLCHAVLEWVHQPKDVIAHLLRQLKKGGILSLTFYNLNGMIYKNLLRANYQKILKEDYAGWTGSLTPTYPLLPSDVKSWLTDFGVDILCHSGMRVFHDYILDPELREQAPETVIKIELMLSRKTPYRDLGRYQHMTGRKN